MARIINTEVLLAVIHSLHDEVIRRRGRRDHGRVYTM